MARVLVIDDDPSVLENLVAFLEDEDIEVLSANNADQALELVAAEKPDVAIVDMRLPGKSGEELIIEARDHYPDQRHIIYTGSISFSLSDQLKELGLRPEHVFLKPVRVLTLLVKCIKELAVETQVDED